MFQTSFLGVRALGLVAALLTFAVGCTAAPAATPAATFPGMTASAPMRQILRPSPEENLRATWRRTVTHDLLATRKGCFQATYPTLAVREVACTTPPNQPYMPALGRTRGPGSGAQLVGNTEDWSATVTTGNISWSEGYFQQVTGVTSENDNGVADKFSLQLNTQFFDTSACPASSPNCIGWEQFILTSSGSIFIQYWLIHYISPSNVACPSGWNISGSDSCWRNAANATNVGAQKAADLAQLRLSGNVDGTGVDSVRLSKGDQFWIATGDSVMPDLPSRWNTSEFNVFGDANSSQAVFNAGSTLVVATETDNGTRIAPTCSRRGFTAETNSLDLVGAPVVVEDSEFPSIVFTESNVQTVPPPAPACSAQNTLPAQWFAAGNTAGFGQVADGRPFWTGNFRGTASTDILFYYPGDMSWWLGHFGTNQTLSWKLAGNTSGFGQVNDGRPFWTGNFRGTTSTDILFYSPGDKNWWLGSFDANGALTWKLAGNTAGFGQVSDGRPFWTGKFRGTASTDILFYSPGDKSWWLGSFDANGALSWKLAGNTAGFGQVADGRPFWVADFLGLGGTDILFYSPGDKNWWLGSFDANGALSWKQAGNTAGFGQVNDGRPFYTGKFLGQSGADLLFYSPGDENWWLGRFDANGALSWKLAGNSSGFGQVNDGRPFWVGNFGGTASDDLLFYFKGDQNWWRGQFAADGTLSWTLVSNTDNFGQVWDGRPFWAGDFDGLGASEILFYYPIDHSWWLGRFH